MTSWLWHGFVQILQPIDYKQLLGFGMNQSFSYLLILNNLLALDDTGGRVSFLPRILSLGRLALCKSYKLLILNNFIDFARTRS